MAQLNSIQDVSETHIFRIVSVILLFLLINFSRNLGIIYMGMLFADWFFFKESTQLFFPTNAIKNTLTAVLMAVVIYFLFIIGASVILSAAKNLFGLNAVLDAMATTSPIFADDPILTIISFGIIIPIIETRFFFGRLFEYGKSVV